MTLIKSVIRKALAVPAPVKAPEMVVPKADRIFFISGHPRSGTNWLSALANLHPEVHCHGEFHFQVLRTAMAAFTGRPWYVASRDPVKREAEAAFQELVRRVLGASAFERKPTATVMGDHTPKPLQLLVPGAKYAVIVRDGRDVLVSWTFHLLRTGAPDIVHEQTRSVFEDRLRTLDGTPERLTAAARSLLTSEEWVKRVASGWDLIIRSDNDAIASLGSAGDGTAVLRLSYEKLHADTERERAAFYRFLGVDPERAAPLSRETNTIPGFGREDPKHFFRKGEVGDWRNYFDESCSRWFKEAAGQSLIDTGYESTHTW